MVDLVTSSNIKLNKIFNAYDHFNVRIKYVPVLSFPFP